MADLISAKGESVIQSYSSADIVEGQNIITYYLGVGYNAGVKTPIMSRNTFYSEDMETNATSTGTTELNFDTIIQKALTLKGEFIATIPIRVQNNAGAGTEAYGHVTIKKIRNSTTTTIGEISGQIYKTAVLNNEDYPALMKGTITNQERFNIGDTLRVNIRVFGKIAGSGYFAFGHDPMNTLAAPSGHTWEKTTIATIKLPAKVQDN